MNKLKAFLLLLIAIFLGFFSYRNIGRINQPKKIISTIEKIMTPLKKEIPPKEIIKSTQVSNPIPIRYKTETDESFLTSSGTIVWTNIERSIRGISSLISNPKLEKVAKTKAFNMFQKQYFEHVSPSG